MTGGEDIWSQYAKGVTKLHDKNEEETQPAPKAKATKKEDPYPWPEVRDAVEPSLTPLPVTPEQTLAEKKIWKKEPLDLRIERNMSLGDVVIEAKLDLHGRTETEAYEAFKTFVERQRAKGKRMLLIITGKGQVEPSVLRTNLPRWCDAPPFDESVMAVRTAAQHHGGDGAYYVLLRKRM